MSALLVSCIVPVFNGERYLSEALDSILTQTYAPVELIVVDDGSTDGTAAVLAGYSERVRALRQPNAGPVAARNQGLRAAQGEFVAFLDADDVWHREKLARQMARFEARPELDACVSRVQNFWIPELSEEAERYRHHRIMRPLPGYCSGTLLARRALFEKLGPFDPDFEHAADGRWFLRAIEYGAVIELLSEALLNRRLHAGNRSRLLAVRSRDEYLQLVKGHLDRQRKAQTERP
ncbi:MAG: putative Sugar transferase-a glycosyl transferase [Deltaproteobacteria bacterium]|nr:putative Sugar transferase-a glycosyl transferase [Deltaproteobacteria bacterium]